MSFFEIPHNFQELLSAEIMPGLSSLSEKLLFGDSLSGNACMIGSRDEECFEALHAFVADECVFNGDGKCVSDMEVAGDIGGRETDGEAFGVGGLVVGVEELAA